jgi:pantetheine-phosphate adenylyltransferase
MRTAICAGALNPITVGHLDVIRRAARMFERWWSAWWQTQQKGFSHPGRAAGQPARRVTADLPNVEVTPGRLLVDYADRFENPVVVRGLRALSDFEI